MRMKSVGIRELKQNASQVLAQVENGESFIVTVQGREVGRMCQPFEAPGYPPN